MDEIIKLENVQDYNRILGAETLHPMVSVTDMSQLRTIPHCRKQFGFYCVFFKELDCGTILYGRSKYDYQEGTMLFISPGQIAGVDDGGETLDPKGWVLSETGKTISEIAYDLGFNYPHHLSRSFKKIVGMTPGEFRLKAV